MVIWMGELFLSAHPYFQLWEPNSKNGTLDDTLYPHPSASLIVRKMDRRFPLIVSFFKNDKILAVMVNANS